MAQMESMKMIILVADAPQHGPEFVASGDSYASGPPHGWPDHGMSHWERGVKVTDDMKDKGIELIFTHISSYTAQFEEKLNGLLDNKMKVINLGNQPDDFATKVQNQMVLMLSELG